jgi:hypothetical protein
VNFIVRPRIWEVNIKMGLKRVYVVRVCGCGLDSTDSEYCLVAGSYEYESKISISIKGD